MECVEKYYNNPKFIHNLWTTYSERSNKTYLTCTKGRFEVDRTDADQFLKIRPFCTGHNSIEQISIKSTVSQEKIIEMLDTLNEIEIIRVNERDINKFSDNDIIDTLERACDIWSEQLNETHLLNDFILGKHTKKILQGWLLETYHFLKNIPAVIQSARQQATNPELKSLLLKYYNETIGHESFISSSLVKSGMSYIEVETSIPLVSTQNVTAMLKALFQQYPFAVLLVTKLIKSFEHIDINEAELSEMVCSHYDLPPDVLVPFLRYAITDANLGHSDMLDKYKHLIRLNNNANAHDILNSINDIKHAFDLQKLEIFEYYSKAGNYFPRQGVDLFGV